MEINNTQGFSSPVVIKLVQQSNRLLKQWGNISLLATEENKIVPVL